MSKGPRTLLVEDDHEWREVFTTILEMRGHEVTACPTGESGWRAYLAGEHQLIILDVNLPDTDGLRLCRRMRGHLVTRRRPVILAVTGRDTPEDLRQILAAGADDYARKPIALAQLEVRLAVAEDRVRRAATAPIRRLRRVLIIEDTEEVREIARLILEDFGFIVHTARSGAEGIAVFAHHHDEIDAVVLDLHHPTMNGEVVLDRLREIRSDVRVVIFTAARPHAEIHHEGPTRFLQRPCPPNALPKTVSDLIAAGR